MSEASRKAVVTTAQVQEALNSYTKALAELSGADLVTLEFDKGARGKGFAVYNGTGAVVDSFETKEDAFVKFTNWVTIAGQVLTIQAERRAREAAESDPAKPTTSRKATAKPAESEAA